MLAVVVIPTEDYYQKQANRNRGADGRASNASDEKAYESEHAVNGSIGQLSAHVVH